MHYRFSFRFAKVLPHTRRHYTSLKIYIHIYLGVGFESIILLLNGTCGCVAWEEWANHLLLQEWANHHPCLPNVRILNLEWTWAITWKVRSGVANSFANEDNLPAPQTLGTRDRHQLKSIACHLVLNLLAVYKGASAYSDFVSGTLNVIPQCTKSVEWFKAATQITPGATPYIAVSMLQNACGTLLLLAGAGKSCCCRGSLMCETLSTRGANPPSVIRVAFKHQIPALLLCAAA